MAVDAVIPEGPTQARLNAMAALVRDFLAAGGTILKPPHPVAQRDAWTAEVEDYYERFRSLPAEVRTKRIDDGLVLLWAAVSRPSCLVAVCEEQAMAAIDYRVRHCSHVDVGSLGSKQVCRGAGTALMWALTEVAVTHGLGVSSQYTADARDFHLKNGRRLDLGPNEHSSHWTVEDCVAIMNGINMRL